MSSTASARLRWPTFTSTSSAREPAARDAHQAFVRPEGRFDLLPQLLAFRDRDGFHVQVVALVRHHRRLIKGMFRQSGREQPFAAALHLHRDHIELTCRGIHAGAHRRDLALIPIQSREDQLGAGGVGLARGVGERAGLVFGFQRGALVTDALTDKHRHQFAGGQRGLVLK